MITKEKLLEIGATLQTAEITYSKYDETGDGEVTLETHHPCFASYTFSVSPECEINLISAECGFYHLDREEIYELNRDIDWECLGVGDTYSKIKCDFDNNADKL